MNLPPRKVEVSGAEFLGGSPKDDPDEFRVDEVIYVDIHPENRTAVDVFRHCQQTIVGGMGVFHQGISALEFKAACWGLGLDLEPSERRQVMADVQFMARIVASEHNERASARTSDSR